MSRDHEFHPDQELDVKGLDCPLPILRAKIALSGMQPGQHLRVLATDPYSVMDFQAYCEKTGHVLLEHLERDGIFIFHLRCRSNAE